ncbi:hypothetical protein [Rhodoluna sp.]|uniref:hypothetical protein n=1 Tax=Rhodoluna sp. TaxID=1969481 RepID=UPI0025CE3C1E|nr:hypothetical protein [Rhodoluna sp.]
MRKPAPVALGVLLATLLAGLFLPSAAFADDDEDDSPSSSSSSSSKSQSEKQETEDKHKEIDGIYMNPGRISVPPIVIRRVRPNEVVASPRPKVLSGTSSTTLHPKISSSSLKNVTGTSSKTNSPEVSVQKSTQNFVAVAPQATDSSLNDTASNLDGTTTGVSINPVGGAAIDISTFNSDAKTPAETFIEAAYVGLGAMAIGALALGITAGTRAIRRK